MRWRHHEAVCARGALSTPWMHSLRGKKGWNETALPDTKKELERPQSTLWAPSQGTVRLRATGHGCGVGMAVASARP